MKRNVFWVVILMSLTASTAAAQNKRDDLVKKDKKNLTGDESWIYNDYDKAAAAARAANKPLLVVFR